MSDRIRSALFFGGAVPAAALLVWAFVGLPGFGDPRLPYGDALTGISSTERHITEAVAGIVFDTRGYDSLGEELILLVAAASVAIVLRVRHDETEVPPGEERGRTASEATSFWAFVACGPFLMLAVFIAAHGHVTPGGGFQGGVVAGVALSLVYFGADLHSFRRAAPPASHEPVEGAGVLVYVAIGLLGLAAGTAYLENRLGLGSPASIVSGGMIPILNVAVAVEVAGAIVLLVDQFVTQTVAVRRKGDAS